MKILKSLLFAIGCLLALVGLVWIGQGSGYFPYPASSFMINQTPWILRGVILAVAGMIGIFISRRI